MTLASTSNHIKICLNLHKKGEKNYVSGKSEAKNTEISLESF